ncbi:hypothetical protein SDC9_142208 [bioreactor metagenome]|uniref:Uncharacterized protein n=1 Tax=bioreactor metagenome TaxID=1076179 RepID=A0A645E081_9ZZZZ
MVDRLALFVPAEFEIAFDSGEVRDRLRLLGKEVRSGQHAAHRRVIRLIVA